MMESAQKNLFNLFLVFPSSTGAIEFIANKKVNRKKHSEIFTDVRKAAHYLKNERSIFSGDYVGIKAENCYEWIVLDLAIQYIGALLVPIDPGNILDLSMQIEEYNLKCVFTDKESPLENVFNLKLNFNDYPETSDPYHPFSKEDSLCIKFTSGTTSFPKPMEVNMEGINHHMMMIQKMFMHTESERIMVFLPLSLVQQRYFIYSSILFNYTILLSNNSYSRISIDRQAPTVILGVPYFFENLSKEFQMRLKVKPSMRESYESFLNSGENVFQEFKKFLGGNIRYLWTGSAPIARETLEFYYEKGIPLYQGYGSSETGIVSKCYPGLDKLGSVGKILTGNEVRFGEDGEVFVKPKVRVVNNYLEHSDNEVFLSDGFIATGDIGFLDEDGFLFINGRKKQMIALSSGKKIFPTEIEKYITHTVPEISDCFVFGDKKPFLIALFRTNSDEAGMAKSIKELNNHLGKDEKIVRFLITRDNVEQFVSSQGKYNKDKLYEHFNLEQLYT